MTAGYRAEFIAGLGLLARAGALLAAQGVPLPILVGGAVVEFDTASQIHSGDFDLVTADDEAVAQALLAVGFRREDRRGWKKGGFCHPDLPIGVELVSGGYFDGKADRARLRLLTLPEGEVAMAPTEDLIADRIGQWVASDRRDEDVLAQAIALFLLAEAPDRAYLDERLRHESAGALGIEELQRLAARQPHHP